MPPDAPAHDRVGDDPGRPLPSRRGGGRLLRVVGTVGGIALVVGAIALSARAIAPMPAGPGHVGIVGSMPEGGFAILVNLTGNTDAAPWIVSRDGGATWTRADQSPQILSAYPEPFRCANEVCYLAHARSRNGVRTNVIERLTPDHRWRREAAFGEECLADNLTIDAKDSARAIVRCAGTTIAYRSAGGEWRLLDVAEVAKGP